MLRTRDYEAHLCFIDFTFYDQREDNTKIYTCSRRDDILPEIWPTYNSYEHM